MHYRVSHPALAALLALLLAAWLPAALAEPPATVSLGGTQNIFDDDREVDDELIPFGAVEFRFTERWAGEFWFSVPKQGLQVPG